MDSNGIKEEEIGRFTIAKEAIEARGDSEWAEFLKRVARGPIIVVVGRGLYRLEKDGHEHGQLLYDYLAEKIASEVEIEVPVDAKCKFAEAAFQFLEVKRKNKNGDIIFAASELKEFLKNTLATVEPLIHDEPFFELARVKSFKIFINTSYDNFLFHALKSVRNHPTHPCENRFYDSNEKTLRKLDVPLFDMLDNSNGALVYNIFGSIQDSVDCAFTETDIIETLTAFFSLLEQNSNNPLSQRLKSSHLVFLGCDYDDWLYRFFIRFFSQRFFRIPTPNASPTYWKYVSNVINDKKKEAPLSPYLVQFLRRYDSQVLHHNSSEDFVHNLFEGLEHGFPGVILPVEEFSRTAFISFPGENRDIAIRLEKQLKSDGIHVWVDEEEMKPGDEIGFKIKNAIKAAPVFIPLISKESIIFHPIVDNKIDTTRERYHYQEWKWAILLQDLTPPSKKTFIPVIIDKTEFKYDGFGDPCYVSIPGGEGGQYEQLKNRLLEIQRHPEVIE